MGFAARDGFLFSSRSSDSLESSEESGPEKSPALPRRFGPAIRPDVEYEAPKPEQDREAMVTSARTPSRNRRCGRERDAEVPGPRVEVDSPLLLLRRRRRLRMLLLCSHGEAVRSQGARRVKKRFRALFCHGEPNEPFGRGERRSTSFQVEKGRERERERFVIWASLSYQ